METRINAYRGNIMTNIEKLFVGDPRLESITDEVLEVIYNRCVGMPIPTILGILEIAKAEIMQTTLEGE